MYGVRPVCVSNIASMCLDGACNILDAAPNSSSFYGLDSDVMYTAKGSAQFQCYPYLGSRRGRSHDSQCQVFTSAYLWRPYDSYRHRGF